MQNRALGVASSILTLLSFTLLHACTGGGQGAARRDTIATGKAQAGATSGGSTDDSGGSSVAGMAGAGGSGGAAGSGGAGGSGGGAAGSVGGGSQCGGLTWDPRPSCEACMEQSCCTELAECDTTHPSVCGGYRACLDACGANPTSDCISACDAADGNAGGKPLLHALTQCYEQHCKHQAECEYPICNSGARYPDEGCASCLGSDASCCAAVTDCAGDPACAPCLAPDRSPSCAANAAYQKVQACESSTCAASCTFQFCGPAGGGYPSAACNDCINQNCCAEYDACSADSLSFCAGCAAGHSSENCTLDPDYTAYTQCVTNLCSSVCGAVLASL